MNTKSSNFTLLLIALLAVASLFVAARVFQRNAWSLDFFQAHHDGSTASLEAFGTGWSHPRAAIWLAMDALARGNPVEAQTLLEAAPYEKDVNSLVVLGWSLLRQGDLAGAVEIWIHLGYHDGLVAVARAARDEGDLAIAAAAYQAGWELDPAALMDEYAEFINGVSGNPELLVALLEKAIGADVQAEQRTTLLLVFAQLLMEEGDLDRAEWVNNIVLEEGSGVYEAYYNLGWIYYERGDGIEPARESFQLAIRIDPNDARGYFAIGQVLSREGQFSEADIWLAKAIERNPGEKWYWFERGRIAYLSGDLDLSHEVFTETTFMFPNWAPAFFEMSLTLRDMGRTLEAIASVEDAIRLMKPPSAWYYLRAAALYQVLDRDAEALLAYQSAWNIDPAIAAAEYFNFLRWRYGDVELTIQMLEKSIEIETNTNKRIGWLIMLGNLFREEERLTEAELAYLKVLDAEPENIDAHLGLGWVYYDRGDGRRPAEDVFHKARTIDPEDGRPYFALGQLFIREGLFAEADIWLAQAIDRDPNSRWYWFERGRIAHLDGNLNLSLEVMGEASSRFPDWGPAHFQLALVLHALDRPLEALESIEKAIEYMETPNAWYHITAAQIYESLGRIADATEAYQVALAIDPSNGTAINGLRSLTGEANPK